MKYEEAVEILKPIDDGPANVRFTGAGMGCDFAECMLGIGRFHLDGYFSLNDLEALIVWAQGVEGIEDERPT
ncbi:MAG: hypothetical protein KAY24_17585 [Candidatus Eisenbacteria sp.]|nr:hypothetical protein [Candidatus Eisenbacteria bacterium]